MNSYLVFKRANPRILIPYAPSPGIAGPASVDLPAATFSTEDGESIIDTSCLAAVSPPVGVKGAVLSLGDAHATQTTAVEMQAKALTGVTVEKKNTTPTPLPAHIPTITPTSAPEQEPTDKTHYIFLGVDPDISEATEVAVAGVIDWLASEKGLARSEAFMLICVAGSLRRCDDPDDEYEEYCEIECAIPLGIFVD
ncbi:hypothetical protein F4781DRAFT_20123 [Annulohypoxylon bovei var. microspora]|nr:hypothetical protein F4781DRAFT_20123 [Annulohypoxylon bovei var. microspora]